jgi:eukaryotic-like serine/threonine-protein kinase
MSVTIAPGSAFAGYRVEELVGRGGMGVVYRATDLSLERPVALKLIAPELARDERFRARFLKEPRLAAALDHPHVIPIHAAGEHDGQLYLAMRYVEGNDLKTLLEREGRLAPARTLAILAQIADALDAAHRRGLVHRDVKPANVLLDEDGHAYLTDFGVSKQVGGADTDTGRVMGTLDYLAPEQIRGERVDGRTDCYALACALYECLAGAPPFRRQSEAETLWAHIQDPPPGLPGLPALDPVLQRALAKDRDERHGSCMELIGSAGEALGGQPGELHHPVSRQDPGLTVAATPRSTFVGRERELAELAGGLDDAIAGRGRLILLAGEPGIGKSRLADELMGHARARRVRVLAGRCWEAGGAPAYWPWVQALRPYLRETEREALRAQLGEPGADLAAVLPEVRDLLPDLPPPTALDSEGARFRLLESVASFLRNAASATPLALFLDDLHAADASSLLLLRFVAGQLAGAPILIVGSYRDTEVGPELAEALADLSRGAAVFRLALKGLSESDTSRLLELTMGEVPADELAAEVQSGTQGNPLFATEIGRLLAAEGSHAEVPGRLPIPEGIREAIGQRLKRRSERCRQVLTLASVVGREFDPDLLERVSGLEEDELFAALEEGAAARLVGGVPESSGRLRFSHILVRDALYDGLPAPRRLRMHRSVAEALEALYARNPEPHLAELAHHYLEAGISLAEKAIEYSRLAGDRASSQHGYEEAARHYASALRVLDATGSRDASRECELLLSFGEVQSRAGSGREAKQALQRAATLARRAGRSDQLARAAIAYGGRFAWARASTDPALVPLLEDALAAVGEQDSRTRVMLLARLAAARRDDPGRERRGSLAEQAVEIARRLGDPVTLAAALEAQWIAVEGPETLARGDGIAQGEKLIALGEEIGDRERVFAGHDYRLHCFWMLGDRAGMEVELEALGALADELRQPAQRWHLGTDRTMLALMEGRLERSEQLISETAALGERAESWNAVVSQRLALFVLRRAQGRLAELEDSIGRSTHEYPAQVRFRCALAHLYAELGRDGDARAAFDSLLSWDLAREHLDTEWFFSLSLLADPCAFLGDEAAAAKLYSLLLPYEHIYALAPVEAVFGSLARALGVLATTLRRFDEAERHFEVAIETERRMRARPWLAHAQHDLAAMLLARGAPGDAERAHKLLEQAVAAYRELGMATWASRAGTVAP